MNTWSGPSTSRAAAATSSFWLLAGITGRSGLWAPTSTPSSWTTRHDVGSSVPANELTAAGEAVVVEVAGDQPGDSAERQQRRVQHRRRAPPVPRRPPWSAAATRRSHGPGRLRAATTRTGRAAGSRTTAARTMNGDDAVPRRLTFVAGATPAVLGIAPEVSEGGHGPIAAGVAEPARGPHRRRAGIVRVGDGQLAGDEDRLAGRRRSARPPRWRSGRPDARGTRRSGRARGRGRSGRRASSAPGSIGCRCRAG